MKYNFFNKSSYAIIVTAVFIILLSCHRQVASTSKSVQSSRIQLLVDSFYTKKNVPGIFVAVLQEQGRNYYSAGFANPDLKEAFDSTTLFEIGSITKTFTAYIVTAVLAENKIADTSSILPFLPDSVKHNNALAKISFLQLLNHTAGFPRLPDNMVVEGMQPYQDYGEDKLYAYLKSCIPTPNGKSNYSNLGMALAGVLAERISKKSYPQLLDEYIFLPFEIVTPENAIAQSNNSQGFFEKGEKAEYWNMNVMAPAGGLKCSGVEMLSYLNQIANPSNSATKKIVEDILTPTNNINNRLSIAKGWHLFTDQKKPTIYWHNGGTYGFSTFAAFIKNEHKAVVVVVNQFNKNEVSDVLGMMIIQKLIAGE